MAKDPAGMPIRLLAILLFLSLCDARAQAGDVRLRPGAAPPQLEADGMPFGHFGSAAIRLWMGPDRAERMLDQARLAGESNIHLHVVDLVRRGLPYPEEYLPREYFYLDRAIDSILTRDLNARVILRIDATFVPQEWADAHPEAMARDEFDEPMGWPALESAAWLKALEEEAKAFCRHARRAPYASRIAGALLEGMHEGQWRYAPMRTADFSAASMQAWRAWLRQRYGKAEQLRAAWGDAEADFENAEPPRGPLALAEGAAHLLNLADPEARRRADLRLFNSEHISKAALRVAGVFKKNAGDWLIGLNYGHLQDLAALDDFAELGHSALGRILESRDIDFLAPTLSVDGRGPAGFGPFAAAPLAAIREAGKLAFVQDDTRTYLAESDPLKFAASERESLLELRRHAGAAAVEGAGLWLFDSKGEGWFANAEFWRASGWVSGIQQSAFARGALRPNPEVAIVIDEVSMPLFAESAELAMPLLADQRADFARAAVSSGVYLQSRLDDIPASARLFYFLTAFQFDAARTRRLHDFLAARKATAVWLFAPGAASPAGFSPMGANALTGLELNISLEKSDHALDFGLQSNPIADEARRFPGPELPALGPTVFANPAQQGVSVWASYRGRPELGALAGRRMEGGWTSVFCASPRPGIGVIRALARLAGAHVWTEAADLSMRFGGDFVAIYCQSGGRREFFAPGPVASAVDLMQNSHLQLESLGGVRFEAEFAPGVPSLIYIESAKAD